MALSLITSIPATCYTSQLQEIELTTTTSTTVTLTINYQAQVYYSGNGQTRVFQADYSPRQNRVKIYDIGSLLETFMLQMEGVQQFIFEFRSGSDSIEQTYAVIYCKQLPLLSAADLAGSNYITNYFTRLVYKGAKDQLPYFAGFGSPGGYTTRTITYSVVYRNLDGTLGTYEMISGGRAGYGVSYVDCSYDVIRNMFSIPLPKDVEILSYSLKQGSSTAVCGGELTQYDITHTRTYEEQSPVLQRAEARRFGEFLTSHYAAVLIDGREYPILIKDYDLKISDNAGEGNTVKFEWQFTTLRTPLISEDYDQIFSPEYTEPFV